jgi:hypothetical protein
MSRINITRRRVQSVLEGLRPRAHELGPGMVTYLEYSWDRYLALAQQVGDLLAVFDSISVPRLLDVGPSYQTLMFQALWPDVHLDSFGFPDEKFPARGRQQHFAFDLNDSHYPEKWPQLEPYHLITFCEVIEHLYTSPVSVLKCLASLLVPGGLLLVTTPNAVSLPHRLAMLMGRHPFEMIRETRDNPGHYREYTREELIGLGHQAGLKCHQVKSGHFSSTGSLASRFYRVIGQGFPPGLRKELMVVYSKP